MTEPLRHRRLVDNLGFAQLLHVIVRDPQLSDGAKITYSLLLEYAQQKGKCWPGVERMAEDRNKTPGTISCHLEELVKRGLISRYRRMSTSSETIIEDANEVYVEEVWFLALLEKRQASYEKSYVSPTKNRMNVIRKTVCKEEQVEEEQVEEEQVMCFAQQNPQNGGDNDNNGSRIPENGDGLQSEIREGFAAFRGTNGDEGKSVPPPPKIIEATCDPQVDRVALNQAGGKGVAMLSDEYIARELFVACYPGAVWPGGKQSSARNTRGSYLAVARQILEVVGKKNYEEAVQAIRFLADPLEKKPKHVEDWLGRVSGPGGWRDTVIKQVMQGRTRVRQTVVEDEVLPPGWTKRTKWRPPQRPIEEALKEFSEGWT